MTLWIVTVNFENTKPTELLINSLTGSVNLDSTKVAIADNASSSDSIFELKQILKKTSLDITIFSNKTNLYYWPAVKKVISNLKLKIGSYPDWVIVCNNDIDFSDKNFFSELEKINPKKYPIIGPKIINSHGDHLNPFMVSPLSKFQKLIWDLYFLSFQLSSLMLLIKKKFSFFNKKTSSFNMAANHNVYAVHGSAIIFSKFFFEKGGWLDDNFEMYGEELTVAEIAKKIDVPVTFIPKLKIIHNEHSSTKMLDHKILFDKAKKTHKYFKSVYLK